MALLPVATAADRTPEVVVDIHRPEVLGLERMRRPVAEPIGRPAARSQISTIRRRSVSPAWAFTPASVVPDRRRFIPARASTPASLVPGRQQFIPEQA